MGCQLNTDLRDEGLILPSWFAQYLPTR